MQKQEILTNYAARREPIEIAGEGNEQLTLFLRPVGYLEMQQFISDVPKDKNPLIAAMAELVETDSGERFTYEELLTLDPRLSKPLLDQVRARLNLEDKGAEKN